MARSRRVFPFLSGMCRTNLAGFLMRHLLKLIANDGCIASNGSSQMQRCLFIVGIDGGPIQFVPQQQVSTNLRTSCIRQYQQSVPSKLALLRVVLCSCMDGGEWQRRNETDTERTERREASRRYSMCETRGKAKIRRKAGICQGVLVWIDWNSAFNVENNACTVVPVLCGSITMCCSTRYGTIPGTQEIEIIYIIYTYTCVLVVTFHHCQNNKWGYGTCTVVQSIVLEYCTTT